MTRERQTTVVRIGLPEDVDAVGHVERDADRRFADAGVEIEDAAPPVASLVEAAESGRLIVAVDGPGIVGFAWWTELDGNAHLEQVSVLVDHAGKRIGRQLIDHVASLASEAGHAALTLTTFADVAWNAPLYRSYGFETLDADALQPQLRERRNRERMAGLDVLPRVAMRRDLTIDPGQ